METISAASPGVLARDQVVKLGMARLIARSWEGRVSRRLCKKVEMLFAHLKRILKLDASDYED